VLKPKAFVNDMAERLAGRGPSRYLPRPYYAEEYAVSAFERVEEEGRVCFTTNDGRKIFYCVHQLRPEPDYTRDTGFTCFDDGRALLFLHGWSGSSRYYDPPLNAFFGDEELRRKAKVSRIVVVDLRGHGSSSEGENEEPCHLARLAVDVEELIEHELKGYRRREKIIGIGSSMGAAILWAHCELFASKGLEMAVFVDQAPLQYWNEGWELGSKGLKGPEDLANLQHLLKTDMPEFAAGNAKCCLVDPNSISKGLMEQLTQDTLRCDPVFLGKLMADHTQLDWRDLLKHSWRVPVLNLAGGKSDIFPVEGVAHINQLLSIEGNCKLHRLEVFQDCNHWLYLEKPREFMKVIVDFLVELESMQEEDSESSSSATSSSESSSVIVEGHN
jgi:pimeloyl-ACP methyl ester carboxylesterase